MRSAIGPQRSPDAGDLVCLGHWRSLARCSACNGVLGRTAHRRLRLWQELSFWDALYTKPLALLDRDGKLDLDIAGVDSTLVPAPGGGDDTGSNTTDRGKSGTKQTLLVDGNGVPLALHTTGANASDQQQMGTIIHKFPHVKGKPG